MELKGAVALVTGGAKGLGLAIANYLHERGAIVVVADLDTKALSHLPEGIEAYAFDVTNPLDVKNNIEVIISKYKCINILVNNAGVIYSEPMLNIMNPLKMMHDYEKFCSCINANLHSVFVMTSAVVEQMALSRTKGVIINISSISAYGNEGQVAYSAAKAGVNAITITLSKELGLLGIRCNAVAPGFIATDSTHQALSESIIKHVQSNTPMRRLGQAIEVAQAVESLITNDFLNGVILDVNGGLTL
ncbi:SDR family NAD(P)-dependent oxidoreductase [Legionella feeleii]|uniref:Dehydrogenase n=1 Tax=Legionella feeleii TaxID=453 RepID=A0A378IXI1_9GAMM|nr:SDR family NAD(P)-dependent oxidoreductase [Legionella feeleii]STX39947.1 dehydrogenase [Legionella feeleii]